MDETIYPHKDLAQKLIPTPESDKKLFIRFIDGNRKNARLENLQWVTMGTLRRTMKTHSKTGYRGVVLEKGKYRAAIYVNQKAINLGFFDTAIEAARAYHEKSKELFGDAGFLNNV